MKTIEEQKIEAIRLVLDTDFIASKNRYGNETAQTILEALKQFYPEPLEVEIGERPEYDRRKKNWVVYYSADSYRTPIEYFLTKQDSLDWCEKKGLKVME